MQVQEQLTKHAEAANLWQQRCDEHLQQAAKHHRDALICAGRH